MTYSTVVYGAASAAVPFKSLVQGVMSYSNQIALKTTSERDAAQLETKEGSANLLLLVSKRPLLLPSSHLSFPVQRRGMIETLSMHGLLPVGGPRST